MKLKPELCRKMSDSFDLVKRYPWLPSLRDFYPGLAEKEPKDFIDEIYLRENYQHLNERILEFFKAAFDRIEEFSYYMDDENNIYFYVIIRIILSLLDTRQITNRVAELYSKTTYRSLNRELNKLSILHAIYKDLNLNFEYLEPPTIYKKIKLKDQELHEKTNFKIHFVDYLRLAVNLRDDYRKLINNPLLNGYVYIKPERLNRLIQEIIRKKMSTLIYIKNQNAILKNKAFKVVFEEIQNIWEEKKAKYESKLDLSDFEGKDKEDLFPPCIKEIIRKAREGQNLNHIERLFVVWFLIAQNYHEEEIINLFSTLPDFDRDKTSYQVRYAIRKGYTPYSCESLKSYNLCYAKEQDDEICLKGYYSRLQEKQIEINQPTRYIGVKKFRISKKENYSNNNERP